jgi:lipopolysaccharide export system permease protein
MKTLHLYLTRQVVASLVMTVLVFTFVLLIGNALKDLLDLLRQVSLGVTAQALGYLIPWIWVFALPMGMLTATLLIFGRFSADQEYTAVRASGISLLSLASPILLLSIMLCGVSALVNMEIGPASRVAYTSLRFRLGAQLARAGLPAGRPIREFPGYIFYVGKNRGGELTDVTAFVMTNETTVKMILRAPRGKTEVDVPNKRIVLTLYQPKVVTLTGEHAPMFMSEELPLILDFDPARGDSSKPNINDMTFNQLQVELVNLQQLSPPRVVGNVTPQQQVANRDFERRRKELISKVKFQIQRQVAFSFACFGFTLIGIPLGIRMHRRETNIGIAVALLLATVYYSFILIGQALDGRPECFPQLIVWIPNFLFQTIGAILLWRANRGL